MLDERGIQTRYRFLRASFNERSRRLWAAAEVKTAGPGGFEAVVRATGISRTTLAKAGRELSGRRILSPERIRQAGGGRKSVDVANPKLLTALKSLVEPATRGDPESLFRWTCKSTRRLAVELGRQGHKLSHVTVGRMLVDAKYNLQANRKTMEGSHHPDRNAQFEYIHAQATRQLKDGCPVISVDTKKKELVGNFKNGGREWHPKGKPEKVLVHDFIDPKKGKAIPYGVYDLRRNTGWVSVGVTHDTSAFAVQTIRKWWRFMGKKTYPKTRSLMITADSGGSNGARVRLWKYELQRFADDSNLNIHVLHFPPGTSKWNKIEHRLFSFITQNWRGKPLRSLVTIVNLIANTSTASGLKVRCVLDRRQYPTNVKVTDEQMRQVQLTPHKFHGDWNYTIKPKCK